MCHFGIITIRAKQTSDAAHIQRGEFDSFQSVVGASFESGIENHGHTQSKHTKQVGENVQALAWSIIRQWRCFFGHGLPTRIRFVNVARLQRAFKGMVR